MVSAMVLEKLNIQMPKTEPLLLTHNNEKITGNESQT